MWRRERDSNSRYRFWNPVRGHTCATCKGFCNNNIHQENRLKAAERQDWSGFMTWRKANGQRFSGRRKYESVAYFPHQKRLAETACVPRSQRSNYSLPMRDKKPNFSASNPVNFLETRFWRTSCWPIIHIRSAHFGLVAVSLRVQQTAIDSPSGILDAQYRSTQSRARFRDRLGLDASSQPRAAIHFETAMRQGLLHSQIGHWPRRSAPASVVTGPDLIQQSR